MGNAGKTRRIVGFSIAAALLAPLAVPSVRQEAWHLVAPGAGAEAASVTLEAVLADKQLHVTMQDGSVKTYAVAIGTPRYPTPTGSFTIRRIVWNPGWVPPDSKWARGKRAAGPRDPANPMKVAKIFFKQPDYYIHGTGHVTSLGTAASHGCLRMHPDEVAELGAVVMQAGGVSHDWDWVKRTLHLGSTRTVNLKHPIRIRIVADRPDPEPPVPAADSVARDSTRGDSIVAPAAGPAGAATIDDTTAHLH